MAGGVVKNKEHPLAGVVLCFTSILPEQRSELAEIASQMGATHKFDLTSDVTHLLVGETNTEKYKYVARERSDVVVLLPQWIEAVRQSWMQGGDTDLKALEQQYKLPTFYGLSICITGFEDMSFRNYLQKTAIANGAEFRKDLTKDVTHLIAREPSGQKYKFATQWKIKVVSVKWFNDSLERGMILDESLYDPLLPHEEQGIGAWNRSAPQVSAKREQPENASNPRARKLRRVASSKLGDQNEGIWGDIMGGGFEVAENGNSDTTHPKTGNPPPGKARPVIQAVKSFASDTTVSDQRDRGLSVSDEKLLDQPEGFLQNCYFFIHGFSPKQADVLRHHLTFNGARIVNSLSEFSSPDIPKTGRGLYTIVPYKLPRSEIPSTDDMAFECEVVTDMWLERCLDSKTLVSPEAHVTSTPLPRFPIPEFHGMRICSTGFARIDLLHLSKLVNIMGATYEEYLTPSVSVLICNDPRTANPEKLRHTLEWGVPTVSADWLWISVQTGQRKPFDQYLVQKPASQNSKAEQKASSLSDCRSKQPTESRSKEEVRKAPERGVVSKPESISVSTKSDVSNPPSANGHKDAPKDEPINPSADGHNVSKPRSPSKGLDSGEASTKPVRQEETTQEASSRNKSRALDLAVSGLLQQVRAFSRASSNSGGETGEQQQPVRRRRPLLGRTNSHSSTRTGPTKGMSRASSVDTLNEDGYGSAVDSVDTDTNNHNSSKHPTNTRGQSFNSILSGGKVNHYIDSPLYKDVDQEDGDAPAMTQLNYEDPDAVAMREELMRHGGKSNTGDNSKDPAKQVTTDRTVLGDIPALEDLEEGWGTGKRTRRAGKPKEPDNNIF
ncbi:hypothetical protein VTN77DRAFT_1314 [Rasamsonia byssochlamydoides]|uniref:uncharacterized protein n=1 Tax=Rasamsonia byssochlamydoides TaxID=89139 RepID=UPI003743EF22